MNITFITLELTPVEVRAIYQALGRMAHNNYDNDEEANAGHEVYNELTPLVGTDE